VRPEEASVSPDSSAGSEKVTAAPPSEEQPTLPSTSAQLPFPPIDTVSKASDLKQSASSTEERPEEADSTPISTVLSETSEQQQQSEENPPVADPTEQSSEQAKSVVSYVNKALPPSYQKEGYNFLLELTDKPEFSLSEQGDIRLQGIDLEPYHITDFLRVAFLTHHQGEIPGPFQEWLKSQSITFPTSQVKLRPKFVPKYSFRGSTLAKAQQH